jgi:hypothetical protein
MSTKSGRITVANRAEKEILRFKDDTVLWMKHCTNQEADPWQAIFIEEIEAHPNSLIVEPPRFGKTWSMEAVCMKELFCYPKETELIFGPKREQADNALREHLNWIENSELLSAYVARRRGKRLISDTKYELVNGSRTKTFGILGHFDSEEASIVRGEEWDDMDADIWTNRVIARGGRANRSGLPTRFRLSGTIQKGKGNMFATENKGNYHVVTKFNVHHGLEFGVYDKSTIDLAREEMTNDEWLRIYLLIYTEAKNYIWESHLNRCIERGFKLPWDGVEYKKGGQYKPRGVVYCGFDCGHSGEKKVHSVYRVDFIEVIGETVLWLNGFEWESTTDPTRIKKELVDLWRYYGCRQGYGDALKANFIAEVNDELYAQGLITFDRSKSPENTPADWKDWDFSPMWNTGKAKYLWAEITKTKIEHQKLVLPYFHEKDDRPIANMFRRLRRCMLNIRMEMNNSSYPSLVIIKKEIGDDPFDAINMAMGCMNDRQIIPVDFSKVEFAGAETETSRLNTSILTEIDRVGSEMGIDDF